MVIISIFLAVIFIVSYSSIGLNIGQTTSTTTVKVQPTAFATSDANALVTGFSPSLNITVACKNSTLSASVFSYMSNSLALLEANNSVSIFFPIQHNISIESGNANTMQIYLYEHSKLNASASACAAFYTGEIVQLPSAMTFTVGTQKVPVILQTSSRYYTLPVTLSQNLSMSVPVKVSALLTQNGSIYGNLSVSRTQV